MIVTEWMDTSWKFFRSNSDALINGAVITCQVAGNLGCMIGGAGIAFLNYMNEQLKAGYYGAVDVNGTMEFDMQLIELNIGFNQTIPFQKNLIDESHGKSYSLTDWTQPQTVVFISTAATVSGVLLRLVGANLSKWNEGRDDVKRLNAKKPAGQEYLYVSASSLLNSVAITSFTCFLSKEALDYSLSYLAQQNFTTPSRGSDRVIVPHYTGPIASKQFPLEFIEEQNNTVCIPVLEMDAAVNERVNVSAITEVIYGLGMFFKPSEEERLPLSVVPITVSIPAAFFSHALSNKAAHARDNRLIRDETPRVSV